MNYQDAAKQYKETSIKTADHGALIVLLYEEIQKHLEEAIMLLHGEKHRSFDKINHHITRAQKIIVELAASLEKNNANTEFFDNMLSLYLYFNKELGEANTKKDPSIIIPIKDMVQELLDSWKQAATNTPPLSKNLKKNINLSG